MYAKGSISLIRTARRRLRSRNSQIDRDFARYALVSVVVLGFLLIVALGVSPAAALAAQTGTERITSYDVDITVETTGSLLVTETIDYDFADNERHGIYRDVPVRIYQAESRYDRLLPLTVLSVDAAEGTPHAYKLQDVGNARRIKIGDPNRTVTGLHRYTITYRVASALSSFPEHDELNWNAIGTEWYVPIERATVRVIAPASVTGVACSGGIFGSRLPCTGATHVGSVATFNQDGLGTLEGLSVVVGFTKGAVPTPVPILEERPSLGRSFSATPATLGATSLLLAAVLAGFARLAWATGRDRRFAGSAVDTAFATEGAEEGVPPSLRVVGGTETPVEFVPPDGIRPGQVGTLVDEVANTLDVTATIVDLAVRGYLRIDEIAKKEGWFGKADWMLSKLKGGDNLRPYERLLFDGLFEAGGRVELSDLRNSFAPRLRKVQDALYDDAVEEGWFAGRPDQIRRRWRIRGAAALTGSLLVLLVLAALTHAGLVGLPLVLGGILLVVAAKRMPRRTAKGTGMLRRVEGFRRFIDESEKDRARFAEQQQLFSEYLPYAIVFGVTGKWAQAFAGLEGELTELSWYGGSDAFSLMGFSHSIDGFAVTAAGTITSTPSTLSGSGSSSSGFSSGGFSGGSW